MQYRVHGFRHGDYIIENVPEYRSCWDEVKDAMSPGYIAAIINIIIAPC